MHLRSCLRSVFFPTRCPFCHTVVFPEEAVCPACREKYPVQEKSLPVPIAGAPQDCLGLYDYDVVREAILRFKFQNFPSAAHGFAKLMADRVRRSGLAPACVTFVPMSRAQERMRGYNQAELLAREVAEELGLPCVALLKKVRRTKQQHLLSGMARLTNLRGAYVAYKSAGGKNVLLCDDIFTTGSTMAACTEALRAAGCAKISEIVIAIAG